MGITWEAMIGRIAKQYGWPLAIRIEARVDVTSDCWVWLGGLAGARRRPRIRLDGKSIYVARWFLYLMLERPLKPKHCAAHHCDNGLCVNPNHLHEATPSDNLTQAYARGRRSLPHFFTD